LGFLTFKERSRAFSRSVTGRPGHLYPHYAGTVPSPPNG
jgi:hypothetical protein